jgi:gamma-glutamyltranspeptidase
MRNLQNESYANEIRAKINDQRVFNTSFYGMKSFKEDHGTTHLSVYANGDAVSYTASINA